MFRLWKISVILVILCIAGSRSRAAFDNHSQVSPETFNRQCRHDPKQNDWLHNEMLKDYFVRTTEFIKIECYNGTRKAPDIPLPILFNTPQNLQKLTAMEQVLVEAFNRKLLEKCDKSKVFLSQ